MFIYDEVLLFINTDLQTEFVILVLYAVQSKKL